jgi:hypothetical protein
MRVLLPKRYLKGIIAFLLFLIGTAALVGATLPASFQQQFGLSVTGSILAEVFHTQTANPFVVTATVATDKQDYVPGATVYISGSGFQAGEVVTLRVVDLQDGDLNNTDPAHQPWNVGTDSAGNITATWVVDPDSLGHSLLLTADGQSSGLHAEASFTDNESADLDQCANGQAPSPNNDGCDGSAGTDWVNGNVGGSKANYFEGDSLPYRMKFDGLPTAVGNQHKVVIEWDTTKSSKHALDYIDTYNQSVLDANPCLGITGCGSGAFSATTFPIPTDPQVSGAGVTQIPGVFTLYGGTITSVECGAGVTRPTDSCSAGNPYDYTTGTGFTGDKSASITVVFTAKVANPVLAWAGHISSHKDWGFGNAAVNVPGSPYHTRLIELDGSGGNQDRSLSADAVFFPLSLTIIKNTDPDDAQVKTFDYTTTGNDLSGFSLTPPNGTTPDQTSFTLLDATDRTVTESDPDITAPQFTLTNLTCSQQDGGGGTGTVTPDIPSRTVSMTNLKEAESITCTYVNTEDFNKTRGKIIVDKVTVPSGDPTLFTFTSDFSGTFKLADQSTPLDSGLIKPATYSVSEGAVADWKLTGKTCTSNLGNPAQDPSSITLHALETITCTFTNTKLSAGISVTKTPNVTDICSGTSTSVTYTYVVKNTGTADFTGTVNVTDDTLGTIATNDTIAAGGSKTYTKTASISATTTNKVTASATTAGGQTASANASATVTAHTCTISITKVPSTTDVCNGSTVSYTIKVTNNSDKFSWTGSVVDDILGTLSASTTLAPGGSKTFTPSGSITGTVKNTATADGKFDDSAGATAKASASATVTGHVCTISITKTPSVTDVCNGSTVSYTIKVTNNSDKFSWTGSVVDDILGTLSASTTLAAGGSATFTPSGTISGTVKNTVTGDGKFNDGSATSAKASASATVTGHVCSINITKTPSTTAVCNGATVSYTIKVTNNSDKFSWTGSVIDDVLGTLNAALTLAAGASQTFTPSSPIVGTVKNTATADGKFSDGSGTAAKASASATVNGYTCRITVKKLTKPSGDPAGFSFTGDLSGTLHDTESTSKDVLATGTYKTTEGALTGWDLTDISCDNAHASGSGSTATYNVALGDNITCTFTNTKEGMAQVIKTFNGSSSDFGGNTFTFQLRSGASAASAGNVVESGTASAGNNTINFATKLVAGATYQLCEQMLPGFMTTLGPPLYSVFNPSGDNSIVCTDFTVDPGQTKVFNIDNQPPPGGMALTIGFWKNWASCAGSNGKQKPVLDQTLLKAAQAGHPITLGKLVLDPTVLGATTACQYTVNLLNKTTINGGKKMSSDPIFNMVAQLLAADLNLAAGAGQSVAAMNAINCAHKLLNDIAFNGLTYNKLTAAQTAAANCLATALDQYNNNKTVQACACP